MDIICFLIWLQEEFQVDDVKEPDCISCFQYLLDYPEVIVSLYLLPKCCSFCVLKVKPLCTEKLGF